MDQAQVPQITADEVYKAMSDKTDAILLDVRTPEEHNRGTIEGSINVPVDTISVQITTLLPDKDKTIYAYCLSGSRSIVAVNTMKQLGYTNVSSITHGLLMWRSKKYPLISPLKS